MSLIISVSGVRGIVGTELGVVEALKMGRIFGNFLGDKDKPVVVAGDTRISGPAVRSAMIAGLLAAGRNAVHLGVATTPTTCFMVRKLNAAGGVIVTASHNPIEWNGIKFIGPDALALAIDQAAKIKDAFYADAPRHAGATECGNVTERTDAHQLHIDAVLANCDSSLIETLRSRKMRVVLDSINGAGAVATSDLLNALGCQVISVNGEPNGRFAHPPEPIPENLKQLSDAVIEHNGEVGFAQDPDADRLAIVDETGRPIGEEYTLALACWYVLSTTPGPVAANLSTSQMIDDVAARFGQTVHRTPVGEAHVARAVVKNNCPVGGEGNGGVIVPAIVPVRDSFSAMAMVLQLMARTGKTISQLVAELPAYEMIKTKTPCQAAKANAAAERLATAFSSAKINTSDGIRIDFPDRRAWVHLRASNTEPIMRIIAEAPSANQANELIKTVQTKAGL